MQRRLSVVLTTLLLAFLLAPASATEKAVHSSGPLLGLRKPRAHYEGRFRAWMEVRLMVFLVGVWGCVSQHTYTYAYTHH